MQKSAKLASLALAVAVCGMPTLAQEPVQTLPPYIAAPEDDFSRTPLVPQHQGDVQYADGQLKVIADNSSLEEILSEIGEKIGMKIDGQVGEERVFGEYGPGDPTSVVAHLLAGAGRNMLLREDAGRHPRELILTPRIGEASPPSAHPSQPEQSEQGRDQERDEGDSEDLPPPPGSGNRRPIIPIQPAAVQPATQPSANGFPPAVQPGTTTQQSPNGVKTPQQIYDQLMQMENKSAPK